jgi:arsenate reductase
VTTIWHNPRCSKSRQTLALLEDNGHRPTVRLYLKDAPTRAEIEAILIKLGMSASQLLRKGENAFKDLQLAAASDDQILDAMVENPVLIERPIVLHDGRAAIGRPPESVLALFN